MPRPSHPPRFDYSNYTWRRVQITKLLVMQFSAFSRHLISLRSKYPPQHCVLNNLCLCSSLNVRDQVSHTYRTIGKIIVLYILLIKFFDSRREYRRFWTECYQALPEFNLFLISSWIKFRFVTVVPKYLNCDTLSNDLFAIFMSRIWPTVWWRESNTYFVFSMSISRPTSLLASIKDSVFL
jgi:hypothetical protein